MEAEKELRILEEERAKKILEELDKLEIGSEKHSRAIEDLCRLSKAIDEDFKVEMDVYYQSLKSESEIKRDEEEIKIKREQLTLEKLKHNKVKGDTMALLGGFTGLTIFACFYEVRAGHLIPKGILQAANYIPKLLKV